MDNHAPHVQVRRMGRSGSLLGGACVALLLSAAGCPQPRATLALARLAPLPAPPRIVDYVPDYGVAGDSIRIVGINLIGADVQFTDSRGNRLGLLALGKLRWPELDSADMVEVILPPTIAPGPLSVRSEQGSHQGKLFNVGKNLARGAGAALSASSEYDGATFSRAKAVDGQLATSFFTAQGDCTSAPSCTSAPWLRVSFGAPQQIARIALRGNREYASGYDLLRVRIEVLGENEPALWQADFDLPEPERDLDIILPQPVAGVRAVRVTSLGDEGLDPGLAELEVFGPTSE